ncbi:MAG: helix-hairpin-helix domain-containing protein [Candidatus Shapirobacteria bacterium]|nr:helix-hairpin-helix domain-containing protein [Candidatus Shapirobacteria bacterium]
MFQPTNQEIAQILRQVAVSLKIKNENRFRINAFQRAADNIEKHPVPLVRLWQEKKLTDIPGIGQSIAQNLEQIFTTGQSQDFKNITAAIPKAVFALIVVPGIGPKTAHQLTRALKIKSKNNAITRLKKAAQSGQIKNISGFGIQKEQQILNNIKRWQGRQKDSSRILLYEADQVAEKIIAYLEQSEAVLVACPLGSLRRKTETVGDIDIAVASHNPKQVINHFVNFPDCKKVLSRGERTSASILLTNKKQVDLRIVAPKQMGSMIQHFTGSKDHNIALRELALKKGFSLSEYGIKNLTTKRLASFSKEKPLYLFLGLSWMPPEIRENRGEVEAAQRQFQSKLKSLPNLVEIKDIKGDLHIHSNFFMKSSHDLGTASAKEILSWAQKNHYQYLAFTEHNPSQSGHSKKEVINLLKKKKKWVEQINYSWKKSLKKRTNKLPFIFNGLEIDIRPDGSLAVPKEAFAFLDFAIVGVHSQFNLDKETMTKRIIKGLSHPKAKILAHPTCRLINKRPPIQVDWNKIFYFCQKNNKLIEINAAPRRLDLPDFLIRQAIKKKIKLVINTDSHDLDRLALMPYGVFTARRGWAQKDDIANTLPLDKIKKVLLSSILRKT